MSLKSCESNECKNWHFDWHKMAVVIAVMIHSLIDFLHNANCAFFSQHKMKNLLAVGLQLLRLGLNTICNIDETFNFNMRNKISWFYALRSFLQKVKWMKNGSNFFFRIFSIIFSTTTFLFGMLGNVLFCYVVISSRCKYY